VAESRLIDAYLTELAYSVRDLDDADDIVDEAADHLACALDAGVPEDEALARFGTAPLVSKVFAEEAKRGGAVSTTLTRRAGLFAMATMPMLVLGHAGNVLTGKGSLHGLFVAMESLTIVTFPFAVWGLRKRHGGLGRRGRVAFWLFVSAPMMLVFSYWALVIWPVQLSLVIVLLGTAMLDAKVLPRWPVAIFTVAPGAATAVITVQEVIGTEDPFPLTLPLVVPLAAAFTWIGWALWREPALDDKRSRDRASTGPLAA
jgi:hypothetical protein